jgi:hypothetical protein
MSPQLMNAGLWICGDGKRREAVGGDANREIT